MNNDKHIILDKELRRDIDEIIQKLKEGTGDANSVSIPTENQRRSRERSLAITKLQESVMWLGMDLKAINDENPNRSSPPKTIRQCAEEAYARYGAVTDFKNFRGDPMPEFSALGEKIQSAWEAAINIGECKVSLGNPYPNSKDPSNTKIEPTTDGLKL